MSKKYIADIIEIGTSATIAGNNILTTTSGYATEAYVGQQISNLVASAPTTLDTLNELAAALGDDPNFATTVTNSIGLKWTQDNTKISNWDTAYGWGNHSGLYLPIGGGTVSGQLTISATAPLLNFVDTNSFTDPNDRFQIRAAGNVGQINWYDDSAGTTANLVTFYPNGDLGFSGTISGNGSGLTSVNATTLDSIDSTGFIREFGTSAQGNINTLDINSGKYRWNASTVGRPAEPQSNEYGTLLHLNYDGTIASQLAYDISEENLWIRNLNTSTNTGTTWKKVLDSGNYGGALDSYYLRSNTSDTMNGDLTVTGSTKGILIDSAGHASLRLDRASTSYDNNVLFLTGGTLDWRIWQDGSSDYLYVRDETGGGGNMVTFKKGGNVGIGTTSPSDKLSVDGGSIKLNNANASANHYLWLNKKEGWDGGILLQRDNALDWQIVNYNTSGDLNFYSYGAGSSVFTIKRSNGNVGIGTTSPDTKLHITSSDDTRGIKIEQPLNTSYSEIQLKADSREYRIGVGGSLASAAYRNSWYLYDNNAGVHRVLVNSSGNVGIGISPSYKLDVDGVVRGRGGYTSDGDAKNYTWRLDNSGSRSGWWRIARIQASQSTRVRIELIGHSSYGGGQDGGRAVIIAQFNNDNNLSGSWYQEGSYTDAITGVEFEQIGSNDFYVNISTGSYSEFAITAIISDGTLTTYDLDIATRTANVTQKYTMRSQSTFLSNVGIGTTSPSYKLHIESGASASGLLITGNSTSYTGAFIANTGSGSSSLYFDASNGDFSGGDYMVIRQNNDLSGEISMSGSAGNFNISMADVPKFTFTQGGNLGIGTTSPSTKLHAKNDNFCTIRSEATDYNYVEMIASGGYSVIRSQGLSGGVSPLIMDTDSTFEVRTPGVIAPFPAIIATNDGNVGIKAFPSDYGTYPDIAKLVVGNDFDSESGITIRTSRRTNRRVRSY
jgi:hypothetical protein